MNVLLIDLDSKIPNLALMQISSHFKGINANVGFDINDPELVFISCVFKKNKSQAMGVSKFYSDAKIHLGGSGIDYNWLPTDMQKVIPDYSLYPEIDHSLGFTTRGCIRNCPFCIVNDKEGKFRRWQHIAEFHDSKFDKVRILDNNVLADKEWFFKNTDYCLEHNIKIDINQGLDVRLLTPEIAERLKELKWWKTIKFAFDNLKDEKHVRTGIELLNNVGINLKNNVQFYILVGFNTTPDEDLYRCNLLKELGTNAFVMPYENTPWTKKIARWANRKWLYWSLDFSEYMVK